MVELKAELDHLKKFQFTGSPGTMSFAGITSSWGWPDSDPGAKCDSKTCSSSLYNVYTSTNSTE